MASSVATAPSSSILTALPARPPTPPKEANHDVDTSAKAVIRERVQVFNPRISLQTPPNTNSPTESDSSSGRARKKVEWSTHTEYREPPQYVDASKPSKPSPLVLTPSVSLKPVKGILKASSSPNPLASSLSVDRDGTATTVNIIEMLDSTIKQLAGSDRDSKLDAYMMLSRALKASNNLPDRVALQDKMSLFMQFIQRDMAAKLTSGTLDSSLVNHSLTLLATFLHFPAIASTLTVDFGVFVLENSIKSFEDDAVPKDVTRHLMQVVALQNFSVKVTTAERVGRLLTALHKLDNHLKGKSIIMSRLHIYKRLVKQARTTMVAHSEWIQDMLTDMLSSVKDIRSQAIGLGLEAGFTLRSDKQLMRRLTEVFHTTHEDELYINFYIKRLQDMLKDKQTSSSVPQIWSVVNLFLRCPLDRWQYYGPWLTLVQSAFNMTDSSTKHEANYAWNRYVYLCLADGKVNRKAISTLCQPLLSQLRRKISSKQQEDALKLRRAVMGGVCNLYYYAFAPMAEKYDPDMLWDVTVHPIISLLVNLDGKPESPSDSLVQAAKLLVGLLDVTTPRMWRQDRIVESQPMAPDELPAIDSKWTRQNCEKVMEVVEPILLKKFLDLSNKESLVFRLWQALVGAITSASAKDIKVSDGTAKFVACCLGLLGKILSGKAPPMDICHGSDKFLPSISNFIQLLVQGLGLLPFTEKRLSMTISNTFEPIATPSQRFNQDEGPKGVVRMPLQHLFAMLSVVPPGTQDDHELAAFFHSAFDLFLRGKNAKARMDMSRELLELIPRNSLAPYGPWLLVSESVQAVLDKGECGKVSGMAFDRPLGPDYREMVSLLERGLTSHPNLPSNAWLSLFNAISSNVTCNFGDAGCALVFVEPLAKALMDMSWQKSEQVHSLAMEASKSVLTAARVPKDRQAIEAARSKLWGAPLVLTKTGGSFDPFENLYSLANRVLDLVYSNIGTGYSDEEVSSFVKAVSAFCENCLKSIGTKGLSKLQKGLCLWIQDVKGKLQRHTNPLSYNAAIELWERITTDVGSYGCLQRTAISDIEPLITAGLRSEHECIVSRTAVLWNTIANEEDGQPCSDSLISAIDSLRSKGNLVLTTGDLSGGKFGAQSASPFGYKDGSSLQALSYASSRRSLAAELPTAVVSTKSRQRKQQGQPTTETTRQRLTKPVSTPRLRHDNSKIQFLQITSSSPADDESQHLTNRQKEVRERQRANAALYSDAPTPSPQLPSRRQTQEDHVPIDDEHKCQAGDGTPKHAKSYDDLISSTPTPRRGQVLQMDDFNDPPSSPPIPRPYPLLSEIQSRSRAGSTIDSWEFSSPPGSPSSSQAHGFDETPRRQSQDDKTVAKRRRTSKRQRRASAKAAQAGNEPSKQKLNEDIPAELKGSRGVLDSQEEASSPQPMMTRQTRSRQAMKSHHEHLESITSHVPPRRNSSRPREPAPKPKAAAEQQTTKPNPEVKTAERSDTGRKIDSERKLRNAKRGSQHIGTPPSAIRPQECITVQPFSPSPLPPKAKTSGEPLTTTTSVPSTPEGFSAEVTSNGSQKKRRRVEQTHSEARSKRRRSEPNFAPTQNFGGVDDADHSGANHEVQTPESNARASRIGRRSRQRRYTTDAVAEQQSEAAAIPKSQASEDSGRADGGDTDEELMSQLVTESMAASQSQTTAPSNISQPTAAQGEPGRREVSQVADTNERVEAELNRSGEAKASKSGAKDVNFLMGALREGLEQLRGASLPRNKVYELEDLLRDIRSEVCEAEKRGRTSRKTRRRKSKP